MNATRQIPTGTSVVIVKSLSNYKLIPEEIILDFYVLLRICLQYKTIVNEATYRTHEASSYVT